MGFLSGGVFNLTPRQALAACQKGAILVDVREDALRHFKMFNVPEVVYLPFSGIGSSVDLLPVDKPLIFADSAGLFSKEAVKLLVGRGFDEEIANLAGGLVEWERDGLPIIIDHTEKLSGSCMCQLRPRNK